MNRATLSLALLLPTLAWAEGSKQTTVNDQPNATPQILDARSNNGTLITTVRADILQTGEEIRFNMGSGTLVVKKPDGTTVATLGPQNIVQVELGAGF